MFWFSYDGNFLLFQGIFHNSSKGKSVRSNRAIIQRYLNNFWNILDILSYSALLAALITRHASDSENATIARRLFSLALLIMYFRFLEGFLMFRMFGRTLIMIKEMVRIQYSIYVDIKCQHKKYSKINTLKYKLIYNKI